MKSCASSSTSSEDIEIVGQASNGPEALAASDELDPDVVFLDIQMPGLTGFEVARRLLERADDAPAVVFVTAYDQHALEAFDVNAVDYLLKPVDAARLQQALARVRRRLGAGPPGGRTPPPERAGGADRQNHGQPPEPP